MSSATLFYDLSSRNEMKMTPVPQTIAQNLIDRINEVKEAVLEGNPLSEFELKRLEMEADKLKNTDLSMAFTVLGSLASLRGRPEAMRDFHKRAIKLSSDDAYVLYNYAVSLAWMKFEEEAFEAAKNAAAKATDSMLKEDSLDMAIRLSDMLGLEAEFIDLAYEWEAIFKKKHPCMTEDRSEDPEMDLDQTLSYFDDHISLEHGSFVELDRSKEKCFDDLLQKARD